MLRLVVLLLADAPADDLLKVLKSFVLDYSKGLGEMRLALSDTISEATPPFLSILVSPSHIAGCMVQAWECENDVVSVNMEPFDRDHIVHMIKGENVQFNKVQCNTSLSLSLSL